MSDTIDINTGIKRTNYGVFIPRNIPLPVFDKDKSELSQPRPDSQKLSAGQDLSEAQERRIRSLIRSFADKAWQDAKLKFHNKYDKEAWRENYKIVDRLHDSYDSILNKHLDKIIKASETKDSIVRKINQLEEERKRKRKDLAHDLSTGRKRLLKLNADIKSQNEELISRANKNYQMARMEQVHNENGIYPSVPPPTIAPHPEGQGLPEASGIYFIWEYGVVEYVGQSTNIHNRLRLGFHHRLHESDQISFLEFPAQYLTWAECYYIGICRPTRNGGTPCRSRGTEI